MNDRSSEYDSKGRPWPKYKVGDVVWYKAGIQVRSKRVIERRGLIIDRRWDTWNDWEYRMRPSRWTKWINEDVILRRDDSSNTTRTSTKPTPPTTVVNTTTTTTTTAVVNAPPAVSKKRMRMEAKQLSKNKTSKKRYREKLCDYDQIYKFKENMQKLADPTLEKTNYSMTGKETRIYKYIDDDVKHGKKEFIVESLENDCYVTLIKCIGDDVESRKKDGKCVIWESSLSNAISGSFTKEYVNIDSVYMGETKGQGNCVKAVAYMIKTLMIEAEKRKQWFPYKGYVYISSNNACAALMCYSKAFMLNGYDYSDYELHDFIDEMKGNSAKYRFSEFKNTEQETKRNTLKSQEQATTKLMSIKLNNLKF